MLFATSGDSGSAAIQTEAKPTRTSARGETRQRVIQAISTYGFTMSYDNTRVALATMIPCRQHVVST